MRFLKTALLLLLAVAIPASTTFAAGGFLQKLPKDGTWVKYNLEAKVGQAPMAEMTGTITFRSVGKVVENGEAFRWIEMEFEGEQNGKQKHQVMKVLVREKDLRPGAETPLKVLRGWNQFLVEGAKQPPKEFSELERSANGPVAFYFRVPLKDAKSIKRARQIFYQKGRFDLATAHAGAGDITLMNDNAPADVKYAARYTVWSHKSVPTGTAAMEIELKMSRKDKVIVKMTMKFDLQDYGTGAKSALPDKK